MPGEINRISTARFLLLAAAPSVLVTVGLILGIYLILSWSSSSVDATSAVRQSGFAEQKIRELRADIEHDQESVTIWDDAIEVLRSPDSPKKIQWIDENLGSWMHTYFGHDAAYVLSPQNAPIYAFSYGVRQQPATFEKIAPIVLPMLAELRAKLRNGDRHYMVGRVLSPGVSDFVSVSGHPAIVSVKPIISQSGEIEQVAREEFVHVAVRFLDSDFLHELSINYRFRDLQFSHSNDVSSRLVSLPLKSTQGDILGYFVWRPYQPGSAFLRSITPMLLLALVFVIAIVATLLTVLYRRMLARQKNEERIYALTRRDALTGLANRTAFEDLLDQALARPAAPEMSVAVIYFGLDRFKQVNDTLGHDAGDGVIRQAAARIQELLPDDGTLCRIGGDEFAAILPGVASMKSGELCRRIITSVGERFDIADSHTFIGVSVGVAFAPMHGRERSDITRKADVALQHAKMAGGGRCIIFGQHMDTLIRERSEIERDLRAALDDKQQFKVVYQPKYAAKTGEVSGVEALLRWHHPARGWISPGFFIPIAEETSLINHLGEYVLEEACQTAAQWPIGTIAVNASAVQLREASFATSVAAVLERANLDASKLEIEVTETAWLDEAGHCEANIRSLRHLGVKIALDDFGTGFSSFGRLRETEVDRIKIDQSFIKDIGKSTGAEAIVRAIVDLAKAHGIMTTAEGVETAEQSAYLRDIGCDEVQGFLFSRPLPRDEIDVLLDITERAGARRS